MDPGCFLILTVVNSAAMNLGVKRILWDPNLISSGYIVRGGIAIILFLIFWVTAILFSIAEAKVSEPQHYCHLDAVIAMQAGPMHPNMFAPSLASTH